MSSSKTEWRTQMRAKRRALTHEQHARAAVALAQQLMATRWCRASNRISCYLSNDGEIDTRILMEKMWRAQKRVYLPVLSHITSDRLWFAEVAPDTTLRPNRFGIPEPVTPKNKLVRAQDLDLILLPLVAFDASGNRLGMGGGFYDRSLAFLRYRRYLHKPRLIGLAHDFQRVLSLPTEPWDVSLHAVVTDRTIYQLT